MIATKPIPFSYSRAYKLNDQNSKLSTKTEVPRLRGVDRLKSTHAKSTQKFDPREFLYPVNIGFKNFRMQYPWGTMHNHDAEMLEEQVSINNGVATLTAERNMMEAPVKLGNGDKALSTEGAFAAQKPWRSGAMTGPLVDLSGKYGRPDTYISCKLKLPVDEGKNSKRGVWPAFWLCNHGTPHWQNEIDLLENSSVPKKDNGEPATYVTNTHWYEPASKSKQKRNGNWARNNYPVKDWFKCSMLIHKDPDPWKCYIKFFYNDKVIHTVRHAGLANYESMFPIINLAIGGAWGSPVPDDLSTCKMQASNYEVWQGDMSKRQKQVFKETIQRFLDDSNMRVLKYMSDPKGYRPDHPNGGNVTMTTAGLEKLAQLTPESNEWYIIGGYYSLAQREQLSELAGKLIQPWFANYLKEIHGGDNKFTLEDMKKWYHSRPY
jgi:hypothetical protein